MTIQMEKYQLENMLRDMAELGAANYAKRIDNGKSDFISQKAAYRDYGAKRVAAWVKKGSINPVRGGTSKNSKILYSIVELLTLEKAERYSHILTPKTSTR